jgi:precorrin-6B methylase 2
MRKSFWITFILAALLLPATIHAQQKEYEPSVGQEGKDVIWVPTPEELVQAMLDLAKVTPQDVVMDLGSGDGRIVIAAAKRGVRATGIEYNPDMVELSRRNAEKAGVSAKATFLNADIFATDFSQATVITMYLLPALNLKLRPTILDLKPGTRIVAHAFNMGEWQCDQSVEKEGRTAYLWIVPAKVAGMWTWPSNNGNAELTLTQVFQTIEGSLKWPLKTQNSKGATFPLVAEARSFPAR